MVHYRIKVGGNSLGNHTFGGRLNPRSVISRYPARVNASTEGSKIWKAVRQNSFETRSGKGDCEVTMQCHCSAAGASVHGLVRTQSYCDLLRKQRLPFKLTLTILAVTQP